MQAFGINSSGRKTRHLSVVVPPPRGGENRMDTETSRDRRESPGMTPI